MSSPDDFISERMLAEITRLRVVQPNRIVEVADRRDRRRSFTDDGQLNLLAIDHPARMVTRAGKDPLAMADRGRLLSRIARVLCAPSVDGILASMDIIEDLLLIDDILWRNKHPTLLDRHLVIPSLNRAGLPKSAWELDDRMTGPSISSCVQLGFDAVKVLMRIDLEDARSVETLTACAKAVSEASQSDLPIFLEPLPVRRGDKGIELIRDPVELTRLVCAAQALGESTRHTWLKLPYVEDFEMVARATTLPIVLLGGEAGSSPADFIAGIERGMSAGHNVRGALCGRNVLFPEEEDPLVVAEAIGAVVHQGAAAEQALELGRQASRHAPKRLDFGGSKQ